jgi:hypothetical protein
LFLKRATAEWLLARFSSTDPSFKRACEGSHERGGRGIHFRSEGAKLNKMVNSGRLLYTWPQTTAYPATLNSWWLQCEWIRQRGKERKAERRE